jgi:hypothetical protein
MESNFNLNIEKVPKELNFILEIIKSENVNGIPFYRDINWNQFLELSMHHRVYPLLAAKLKKADKELFPPNVIKNIEQSYKRNTFHMLRLSAEMEKVSKLFNENQISVLALKGPILGADLYGDISLRTSGDLDVLVPMSDIEKAEKLLIKQGYVKDDYIKTVLNDWKWRHHHVTYFHPTQMIKVEIHWRLNPGPRREPSFNELWQRKRKSSITSYPVYYLGREDLFLFLVSHGSRHGWSRLRWLVDIDQIVKQNINWTLLIQLLKKYQYLHIGGQAVVLCSELFNTSIKKEMKPLVKGNKVKRLAQEAIFYLERMIDLHSEPVPEDISAFHKRHLFKLMSKKQKIIFILSFLYPYPEDAETLPLPKMLHFLYFPLRPVIWAWRRTKQHALS